MLQSMKKPFLALFVVCLFASRAPALSHFHRSAQHSQRGSVVQLLTAKIDRTSENSKPKNTYVVTGKSLLRIKKVDVAAEDESGANYTLYITTDQKFSDAEGAILLVKAKDKLFLPFSFGGDAPDKNWSIELRNVDRASAERLYGKPLELSPKASFKLELSPYGESYALGEPVKIGVSVVNVGAKTFEIFASTTGGGNYRARDTNFSFTATLDGVGVAPVAKPLPDGFISSPFVSKPNNALRWSEDLDEWLLFDKPGKYLVRATYRLQITNPTIGASPIRWNVFYTANFSIHITNANTAK